MNLDQRYRLRIAAEREQWAAQAKHTRKLHTRVTRWMRAHRTRIEHALPYASLAVGVLMVALIVF